MVFWSGFSCFLCHRPDLRLFCRGMCKLRTIHRCRSSACALCFGGISCCSTVPFPRHGPIGWTPLLCSLAFRSSSCNVKNLANQTSNPRVWFAAQPWSSFWNYPSTYGTHVPTEPMYVCAFFYLPFTHLCLLLYAVYLLYGLLKIIRIFWIQLHVYTYI